MIDSFAVDTPSPCGPTNLGDQPRRAVLLKPPRTVGPENRILSAIHYPQCQISTVPKQTQAALALAAVESIAESQSWQSQGEPFTESALKSQNEKNPIKASINLFEPLERSFSVRARIALGLQTGNSRPDWTEKCLRNVIITAFSISPMDASCYCADT